MAEYYQNRYDEPGLTTELPSDEELASCVRTNFSGTSKDFSYIINVLLAVGVRPGDRVLDFGANWGYALHQFRRAEFLAEGYETSVPRAAFGRKFGLEILTSRAELSGPFDAVYSCHVLEHVPDPTTTLKDQLSLTKTGGLLIGHTPNGSKQWRERNPRAFRKSWGKVHPVLLTDVFIQHFFRGYPTLVTSNDDPTCVADWDRQQSVTGDMSGSGLFFSAVNRPVVKC